MALFAVGVFSSVAWLAHPWYDPKTDASIYIATARSLAAGEGYSYLGEPFRTRPPGFAVLIAPFVARPEIDFFALHVLIGALGAAGVLLLHLHLRPRLGWMLSLALSLCVWLNPGYRELCNMVLSDVPAAAAVYGCLVLERWSRARPSWRRELALGLAIAAAAYLRTIALLLVPAIAAARGLEWARARPRGGLGRFAWARCGVVTAAAVAALLPWTLRDLTTDFRAPADHVSVHSYATALWHVDKGDPGSPRLSARALASRARRQTAQLAASLACRMQGMRARERCARLAPLAIPLLGCVLIVAVRRREPADFFAIGALAAVAGYFGFQDRLLLPAWPLVLASTVEVARDALRPLAGPRAATVALAAALLALCAADFAPRRRWQSVEARDRELRQTAAAFASRLGEGDRVGSAVGADYAVFLDRPVYSLRYAVRRAGGAPEAAEALIDRCAIDVLVFSESSPEDRELIPYFAQRYGAAPVGDGLWVIRVRP